MNAATRTRCLRAAYLRYAITFLPLAAVGCLAWAGHTWAAGGLFVVTAGTMMTATLMPRCSLFGRMLKKLPAGTNQALLTIDDGPHPEHTPAILDLLDRHHIKALFFLVGDRAAQHPDLVRSIVARGHEIGNHTQTHPATSFWSLKPARMWQEIAGCQDTLTQICPDHAPRWFRPPAGHHNLFTFVVVRFLGLRMMMWNARGFDGVVTDVEKITSRIRSRLKPGAIVLIHEGTPVAIAVAEAVTQMLANSRLDCGSALSALPLGHDEVVVERRAAP